ncbi:MAG: hypothetical protein PF693_15265 [Spirochaetia bacterium]|jgi:hypothetical protein|nr:hypothetical protein [Spirochaetia bacterium]
MEEINNICIMERRLDGKWNPAVYSRYNYSKVDLLKEFTTIESAVQFAKDEIKKHTGVTLCVSSKYLNRPETLGLSTFKAITKKPDYCTQNEGDCQTCSLVNYGRDCQNNPIEGGL